MVEALANFKSHEIGLKPVEKEDAKKLKPRA